ncbi:hypothetical protein NXF25_006830 [Crotalus adamanteus]|uniref:Uncharacterized protein n=1 Tax=Crotalus adamanteus TaxID=8729 RepID=A0AAW1C1K6_CROAD
MLQIQISVKYFQQNFLAAILNVWTD